MPYAEGLARHLTRAGAGPVTALESAGSRANLAAVNADPAALGLAILSAADTSRTPNVRALLPIFRTCYHFAAARGLRIESFGDLNARRVGVGPEGGPDAALFAETARGALIFPVAVHDAPEALAEDIVDGRIDALWLGAPVPIPLFRDLAQAGEAAIRGVGAWEIARATSANPRLSPAILPAGLYPGQTGTLAVLAAWNVLVAHQDLPDSRATAILRAVFGGGDPARDIHPAALRFYREMGIAVR